ncbi:MAG: hypothetical protein M0Z67_04530 [Nitrospiraceae bacterium]|nr:hypothetical protein [Nitrospiraceae bacterium]
MNLRENFELFRYLMEKQCLKQEDIVFVDNIADWCKERGIPEPDKERPLKLILRDGQGCKLLVREDVPDETIDERIRAVRIRNQVTNVASSKADLLASPQRKLAFLFLNEYAYSLPDVKDDLLADEWAFNEMERLGYFKTSEA